MFLTFLEVAVLAVLTLGAVYVSPHLVKLVQIRRLRALCRRTRSVVLTFDDGPGLYLTPRLLLLLASARARATFFPTADSAGRQPGLMSQVRLSGHEIGCHGRSHLHAWKTWPWRAVADVYGGFCALDDWLSTGSLFRPPYGKVTLVTWLSLLRRGARVGWWSIDSGDTWGLMPDPDHVVKRVERDGGGVILMHDFDRLSSDARRRADFVLQVTQGLLDLAGRRGWTVRTLSDLLDRSCTSQGRLRQRRISVLAIASGGGHWVQLLRVRKAFEGYDVTYVTVNEAYRSAVPGAKFYAVNDANRWSKLGLMALACRVAWIVLRVRPDVAVSTGAAPGFFGLLFSKLCGARTVWIDSIANVERLSMSGERVARFADLWLTQWPDLARETGPTYVGTVL